MDKNKLYFDIVQAFKDKQHLYYYDKKRDKVIILSKVAYDIEYGTFQLCETKLIEQDRKNFIPIRQIDDMDLFEWMDDFCYEKGNPEIILNALNGDSPIDEFYLILENNKTWEQDWNEFLESKLYKEAKKFICRL